MVIWWFDWLTNRGSTGSPTGVRQDYKPWLVVVDGNEDWDGNIFEVVFRVFTEGFKCFVYGLVGGADIVEKDQLFVVGQWFDLGKFRFEFLFAAGNHKVGEEFNIYQFACSYADFSGKVIT